MKQEDILQTLLADVKKVHPIIEKSLINERDQFLAEKIRSAPGEKIVAVVGAAHAPGIKKYLAGSDPIDLEELNQVPRAGNAGKILKMGNSCSNFIIICGRFFNRRQKCRHRYDLDLDCGQWYFCRDRSNYCPCSSHYHYFICSCCPFNIFKPHDSSRLGVRACGEPLPENLK